jgi:hypothetical protein
MCISPSSCRRTGSTTLQRLQNRTLLPEASRERRCEMLARIHRGVTRARRAPRRAMARRVMTRAPATTRLYGGPCRAGTKRLRTCCARTPRVRTKLVYSLWLGAMCKAMSWIPTSSTPPSAARAPWVAPPPADLIAATQRRDAVQVQGLLVRGAAPNGANAQALCVAAHDGSLAIVRMLLDAGADVDARRGLPLILAVDAGHLSVVHLLLARGADPNGSNGEAFKLARHMRRDDIARVLIESGATVMQGEPATRSSSELPSPTAHAIERQEDDKEN